MRRNHLESMDVPKDQCDAREDRGGSSGQWLGYSAAITTSTKRRVTAAIAGLIVVAGVVAGTIAYRHSGTATSASSSPGSSPGAAAGPTDGFAFINGTFLAPPYTAEVKGDDIQVNGVVIDSIPVMPTATPPTTPLDALDVVTMGQSHFPPAESVTDEQRAAVVTYLKSFPQTARVDDDGSELMVTDRAGNQAGLLMGQRLINIAAERTALQARADNWNTLLHTGGLLMSAPGVTVEAAAPHAAEMLVSMRAADTESNSDRERLLERVTGAPAIAQALVAAGPLPTAVTARLTAVETLPEQAVLASRRVLTVLATASTTSGIQTPRSNRAFVFDFFSEGDDGTMRKAALDQGYSVTTFRLLREATPLASLTGFVDIADTGGAGMLYIASHGTFQGVLLQTPLKNGGVALTEAQQLDKLKTDLNLDPSDVDFSVGGIYLKFAAIKAHWKDEASIVFLGICHGWSMRDAFAAREFIGTVQFTSCAIVQPLADGFFSRLDGLIDDGAKRAVGDAYAASAVALGYESGSPAQLTTLSQPVSATDKVLHVSDASAAKVGLRVIAVGVNPAKPADQTFLIGLVTAVDTTANTVTMTAPLIPALPLAAVPTSGGLTTASIQFVSATGLRNYQYVGNGQTVLAPSIATTPTATPLTIGASGNASVGFDSAMDISTAPQSVVVASGPCAPVIDSSSAHWADARTLTFGFTPKAAGTATFRVLALKAKSADNGTLLDGNTRPAKNRSGPAGDDYTWTVTCNATYRGNNVSLYLSCQDFSAASCHSDATITTTGSSVMITTEVFPFGTDDGCGLQPIVTIDGGGPPASGGATEDFEGVNPGTHTMSLRFTGSCPSNPPECQYNADCHRPLVDVTVVLHVVTDAKPG